MPHVTQNEIIAFFGDPCEVREDTGYQEGDTTLVWSEQRTPENAHTTQGTVIVDSEGNIRRASFYFRPDGFWSDGIAVHGEPNTWEGAFRVSVNWGSGGRQEEDRDDGRVGVRSDAQAALNHAEAMEAAAKFGLLLERLASSK